MKRMERPKSHKNQKRFRNIAAVSAVAVMMVAAAGSQDTSAYFTTYVSAGGGGVVDLGSQTTEIHEDVSDMTKHISITNTSQINDCFVRVKIFHGGELDVVCEDMSESKNAWTYSEEDGYWYYGSVLPAGASTEILDARIGDLPEDFDRDSFNVVVVQECTPVIYDEEGKPSADWTTVYQDYEENSQQEADSQGEGDDMQ